MTTAVPTPIDLDRLLRLRLVVARFGEMDLAHWWHTNGMLGRRGAVVLKRGFPVTHFFAQARVVFAVARSRCQELFHMPRSMTLWSLPVELEEAFDDQWQTWLDEAAWNSMFERLAYLGGESLLVALSSFELLSQEHRDDAMKLRRSAEGRAVPLPGIHVPSDDVITLLAAGFSRGQRGSPAIPYARLEN